MLPTSIQQRADPIYNNALDIIHDELKSNHLSETKIHDILDTIKKKYTADDIIRAADAIQRFGIDALAAK